MNDELQAFRDALREAGQPWSRQGVVLVGAGILGWLIAQLVPAIWVVYVALISAAAIMVGWVFLVIAFVKRRAWAKAQPLREPPLPFEAEP